MRPLSNQQRLHLINTEQLYQNWKEAFQHARSYRYGMWWKKSHGSQYLFRASDARGYGKSLGPRSAKTERTYREFQSAKKRTDERLQAIETSIAEQARLNKALRLNRVPLLVAKVLRELQRAGVLGDFTVLGTQALYAYEALGGVQFIIELLASGDVDLLYDTRTKLSFVSGKMDGGGLLGLLKKADKTFEPMRSQGFRVANAGNFMVDLIIPPQDMRSSKRVTFAADDLVASEVPGLQWLISAPKFDVVSIAEDGRPVEFRVPDPRAFSVHKLWLSTWKDRAPVKRPRDLEQAKAVASIVREQLVHLPFEPRHLKFFPRKLVEQHLLTASGGPPDPVPENQ